MLHFNELCFLSVNVVKTVFILFLDISQLPIVFVCTCTDINECKGISVNQDIVLMVYGSQIYVYLHVNKVTVSFLSVFNTACSFSLSSLVVLCVFQGFLENSSVFYSFYTRGSLDLDCLNTPLLFLLGMISVLFLSIIMVVRRSDHLP